MARGGLALLGDAAHPMLPYLAQGAGMSIEDAQVFSMCWGESCLSVPERLRRYAELRWQRCAKVQRRALRNANVFHVGQPLLFMRNMAMRTLGARLLDTPWLYSH
jgi:salicylate hydroxylase